MVYVTARVDLQNVLANLELVLADRTSFLPELVDIPAERLFLSDERQSRTKLPALSHDDRAVTRSLLESDSGISSIKIMTAIATTQLSAAPSALSSSH